MPVSGEFPPGEASPNPSRDRQTPLRLALERMRNVLFRSSSPYTTVRSTTPLIAMGLIWLWVTHAKGINTYEAMLSQTITLRHILLACGVIAIWNVAFGHSLYRRRSVIEDMQAELGRVAAASVCAGSLLLAVNIARGKYGQGLFLAATTAAGLIVTSLLLLLVFGLWTAASPYLFRARCVMVIGGGARTAALLEQMRASLLPLKICGFLDDGDQAGASGVGNYLGPLDSLEFMLKAHPVEMVLIGLPMRSNYDKILRVIQTCETVGVEALYMDDIFETRRARLRMQSEARSDMHVWTTQSSDPKRYLKRVFDVCGASLLLLAASPVMIVAALAVRLTSKGPVIFVQHRFGLHRERFRMYKFRSMVVDAEQKQAALEHRNEADGPVFKLRSDPRITRVGALLRKTSIDELPQLFNVLRGDMSLVGPRPLPPRDVDRFADAWLLRRFSVRPGLTCIWQVSGRSDTSFQDWIQKDLKYIDEWSLALDLKICFQTIPAVLKGSGAV